MMLDIEPVKGRAQGAWPAILTGLGLEAHYLRNRHGPCPACGGTDRFRFDDRDGRGTFYCNQCGAGDGFTLLARVHRWTFQETLQAVARWLGMEAGGRPVRQAAGQGAPPRSVFTTSVAPAENRRRRQWLHRCWDDALAAAHPHAAPLRRYLQRRGLQLSGYPPVLRLHPGLRYIDAAGQPQGRYPTLLARVVDTAGQLITLHRTYLTATGEKAPVSAPKKLMSYPRDVCLRGGAIQLDDPGSVLNVTEGLETALAVRQALGPPVWALISAGLLAGFQPPPGVRRVGIWADRDLSGAGQQAAHRLAARLIHAGLQVHVYLPDGPIPPGAKSVDWLDVLIAQGEVALRTVGVTVGQSVC